MLLPLFWVWLPPRLLSGPSLHFQVLRSTSVAYSWLLPILKFLVTCLYSCSFPGLLPRLILNDWRPIWESSLDNWAFTSLHKSSSSLLCCVLLKCENSLLFHCHSSCQLFAWLNLTVSFGKCTCIRIQLPCGWVYDQVLHLLGACSDGSDWHDLTNPNVNF